MKMTRCLEFAVTEFHVCNFCSVGNTSMRRTFCLTISDGMVVIAAIIVCLMFHCCPLVP